MKGLRTLGLAALIATGACAPQEGAQTASNGDNILRDRGTVENIVYDDDVGNVAFYLSSGNCYVTFYTDTDEELAIISKLQFARDNYREIRMESDRTYGMLNCTGVDNLIIDVD